MTCLQPLNAISQHAVFSLKWQDFKIRNQGDANVEIKLTLIAYEIMQPISSCCFVFCLLNVSAVNFSYMRWNHSDTETIF